MSSNKLYFPQVLLLGNGLNRAYGADGWSELLKEIWTNKRISHNDECIANMPFSLQAVLGTEDHVNRTIKENQSSFCGVEDISQLTPSIKSLLRIGFDYILTTNYSYEIERVGDPKVDRNGKYCKNIMSHTSEIKRAEGKYLLHTYNKIMYEGMNNLIWHIHGEARKTNSVILGHYYYGCLLEQYQKLLHIRANKQYELQRMGKPPILASWLDAFIMGDVYVLGFGFDFSEIDLWWLLNRKKRENAEHGKLYFYSPVTDADAAKLGLLESYGAKICNLSFWNNPTDYRPFYKLAIEDIQHRVELERAGKQ